MGTVMNKVLFKGNMVRYKDRIESQKKRMMQWP